MTRVFLVIFCLFHSLASFASIQVLKSLISATRFVKAQQEGEKLPDLYGKGAFPVN